MLLVQVSKHVGEALQVRLVDRAGASTLQKLAPPLPVHLDVGLVQPPATANWHLPAVELLHQLRRDRPPPRYAILTRTMSSVR